MSDISADDKILSAVDSGDLIGLAEAMKAGANINTQDNYGLFCFNECFFE